MDGLDRIGDAVYGRQPTAREFIGGPDAPVLRDAAAIIEWHESRNQAMSDLLTKIDRAGILPGDLFAELDAIFMGRACGCRPIAKGRFNADSAASGSRGTRPTGIPGVAKHPAVSAIEFALNRDTDEGLAFLDAWMHGDFDAIRKEWPECPASVRSQQPAARADTPS